MPPTGFEPVSEPCFHGFFLSKNRVERALSLAGLDDRGTGKQFLTRFKKILHKGYKAGQLPHPMALDTLFTYTPFAADPQTGAFTEASYDRYLHEGGIRNVLKMLVTEPFETALKKAAGATFNFDDLTITKKMQLKKSTSWQKIYDKTKTFLEIRADDSRASGIEGLKYVQGAGYCIAADLIGKEIGARIQEFTTASEYPQLSGWERRKKGTCLREIYIPERNYAEITKENAKVCQSVKIFVSSLEDEVLKPYIDANRTWLSQQTGYDKQENIPPEDKSPVIRLRPIAPQKFAIIKLSRVEEPKYEQIINSFTAELETLKEEPSALSQLYRITIQDNQVLVNIKKTCERLATLYKENTLIKARHNIEFSYSVE